MAKGKENAEDKTNKEDERLSKLPKEVQQKLKAIKTKLDNFSKQVVKKFDKYIIGIALLPPPRPMPEEKPAEKPEEKKEENEKKKEEIDKKKIHVLVLVDDTDSQKMTKMELKTKLSAIIENIAKDIDKNITPQTIILTELWQSCYDGKYDLLQLIALSAPVYDAGMLAAIKISEVHKTMILKKFEKYIISYVLAGSLVQGKATKTS